MIISRKRFEREIAAAVEKANQARMQEEENRAMRRDVYDMNDRLRMELCRLETRIEKLEGIANCDKALAKVDDGRYLG